MIDVMLQINDIVEGPIKDLTLHVVGSLFPPAPSVDVKFPETVGDFAPNLSHGDFAPNLSHGDFAPQGDFAPNLSRGDFAPRVDFAPQLEGSVLPGA